MLKRIHRSLLFHPRVADMTDGPHGLAIAYNDHTPVFVVFTGGMLRC